MISVVIDAGIEVVAVPVEVVGMFTKTDVVNVDVLTVVVSEPAELVMVSTMPVPVCVATNELDPLEPCAWHQDQSRKEGVRECGQYDERKRAHCTRHQRDLIQARREAHTCQYWMTSGSPE